MDDIETSAAQRQVKIGDRVEFGNAFECETQGTGWFIGFSAWAKSASGLRHVPADMASTGLCVKWYQHPAGHPDGDAKPVSEGRTISMLTSEGGEFRIEFSDTPAFEPSRTLVTVLRQPGDFAAWGPGVWHRAFGVRASHILTVRWQPQEPRSSWS